MLPEFGGTLAHFRLLFSGSFSEQIRTVQRQFSGSQMGKSCDYEQDSLHSHYLQTLL